MRRLYNATLVIVQFKTRVEAGSNTSTVTLRLVGGDEKKSLKTETVKYGCESKGLGPEKDCAGEDQQHIQIQNRPLVREGAPQNKTVIVKQ
jgi:hypothetical protein